MDAPSELSLKINQHLHRQRKLISGLLEAKDMFGPEEGPAAYRKRLETLGQSLVEKSKEGVGTVEELTRLTRLADAHAFMIELAEAPVEEAAAEPTK